MQKRDVVVDEAFPDDRHAGGTTLRKIQKIELRILKIIDHLCAKHGLRYWLDGGTLLGAVRHRGFIPWDDDIDIVMPRHDFDAFIAIARSSLPRDLELDAATEGSDEYSFNIPCRIRDRFSRIEQTHSADNLGRGVFVDVIPSDVFHHKQPSLFMEKLFKRTYSNATKVYDLLRSIRIRRAGLAGKLFNVFPLVSLAKVGLKILNWFARTFLIYRTLQSNESGMPGYGFDVRWTRIFKREDIFPLQRIRFEDADFLAPFNTDGVLRVFYGANYMTLPPVSSRGPKHLQSLVVDIRCEDAPVRVE